MFIVRGDHKVRWTDEYDAHGTATPRFTTVVGSNPLADMLIDREDGQQLLRKISPFADQVAQEKGCSGVTTRNLFVALGRML